MKFTNPLNFPPSVERSRPRRSAFRHGKSVSACAGELLHELRLHKARDVVIACDLALTGKAGNPPYANQGRNVDSAVVVYFKRGDESFCFPMDLWDSPEDNIWAIAKTINSLRGIKRWGGDKMFDMAFSGFAALPAPEQALRTPAHELLGVEVGASADDIENAYRQKAKDAHPDHGGSNDAMARLTQAKDILLKGAE